MTFLEIKDIVSIDLGDPNKTHYSDDEINKAVQNAYNDIVAYTKCIYKTRELAWRANRSYYRFSSLVSDYLSCFAIFDKASNRFLYDDTSIKGFNEFSPRWEVMIGTPEYWATNGPDLIAIYPKKSIAAGNFVLHYSAKAPEIANGDTPKITASFRKLLHYYATAELLEDGKEFNKALDFWERYYDGEYGLPAFKTLVQNLAQPAYTPTD